MKNKIYISILLIMTFANYSLANNKSLSYKFSGYLDMRMNAIDNDENPNTASSGNPESGFSIEEAALYALAEGNDFSLFLDLPLSREEVNSVSNTNELVLGEDRAQAYLKLLLKNNINLIMGQFDSPYGVEANDSKDRLFAKTGLLYDHAIPVTHTGVSLEATMDQVMWKLLVANSNNKGSLGSSPNEDNQYEYGFAFGFNNEKLKTQIGYLTRPIEKNPGAGNGSRNMIDLMLGVKFEKVILDFEWAQVKNDVKANKKTGDVFLIMPSFQMTEKVLVGLRYENLNDDVEGTGTFEKANSFGLTGHWTYNEMIKFKADFVRLNYEPAVGSSGSQTRWTVSSLINF